MKRRAASRVQPPAAAHRTATTHARIWAVVRRIPRGRVATYGQIATWAGFPRQARLAGYALHALPAANAVPWHRVVAAGGRIALPDHDGRASLQRALLRREGVVFSGLRVDLERCAWRPRVGRISSAPQSAHGRKQAPRRA
jgi:methylated-DNA-protein-cysteine methyltransferase-like protein